MASRLQDVILRGLAAARPLFSAVAPGTLYYSTDTHITERCADNGLSWESFTDTSSTVGLHHTTHESGGTDVVTLAQSQVTNLTTDLALKANLTDPRFTDARAPTAHATTHSLAASDPVTITNLAGFPGGTTTFLRADHTFAVPVSSAIARAITFVIDGGGSVITTGIKSDIYVPYTCTISAVTMLADQIGSIVIDIWKNAYASYPPTVANTITASAKPTITTALKSQNTTLTGWTTAITAGDTLRFNVDSVATITKLVLVLTVS